MSKVIAVVAIIALIVAAFALTFGITIFMSSNKPIEKTVYYHDYSDAVFSNPIWTWLIIGNLNTTFEVDPGETVYLSYQGQAAIFGNATAGDSMIQVNLVLDGVIDFFNYNLFASNTTDEFVRGLIGFQIFLPSLPPGPHSVTIAYIGNTVTNRILLSTLFIQVFPAYVF